MEDKYRLLLFKYIYNELNLHIAESLLAKNGIDYITNEIQMCKEEKICHSYSNYFYLLNKINIDNLNENELNFLENIDENDNINEKIIEFLNNTISTVLFKNATGKDIYYGPYSKVFLSKDNVIALGLKYDEFGFAKSTIKTRKEIEKNDKIIANVLSFINNPTKYGIQIILYNELFEKLNKPLIKK